jgi:hypothetical protein
MYQTSGFAVPSVVVTIGPGTSPLRVAHHATDGGPPGGIRIDITTAPLGPPAGHFPPPSRPITTYRPFEVVYDARAE